MDVSKNGEGALALDFICFSKTQNYGGKWDAAAKLKTVPRRVDVTLLLVHVGRNKSKLSIH